MPGPIASPPAETDTPFCREVTGRLGVFPNFFGSAQTAPGLLEDLWNFARSAYLDNPLPSLFKERLFVHLSRFCPVRYCIIRHLGFLTGLGMPAGDPAVLPQTIDQGIDLLRRPVPDATAFEQALMRLERTPVAGDLPAPEAETEADLFDVLSIVFLAPLGSARARNAVTSAVGEANLEYLLAFLAFIRTAHYWTETHPDIDCEPDMLGLMARHEELARLLLDPTDAAQTRGQAERAQALTTLRESEGRFYAVADLVPDLLWGGDPSGHTTWYNRRWRDYTGLSLDRSRPGGWLDAIHPDDRGSSLTNFEDAIRAGHAFQQEHRIRGSDGVFRWFLMRGEPVRDVAGRIIEWFGSATDINEQRRAQEALLATNRTLELRVTARTADLENALSALKTETAERSRVEDALRHSQKMEAVGQLTGGIAHDFNNLLTGIIGSLELLTRRVSQGRIGELDRYIGIARDAAERAAALTQRLLAFARRQTLDPRAISANRQVSDMADLIRRTVGPSITLGTDLSPDLWLTLCDPNQLGNALLNLCLNARDAMPDGGHLTLATTNISLDTQTAGTHGMGPGDYVVIAVSDEGAGMAAEVVARAFEPFYTTKVQGHGTGLGLSMIHGFAQQSGGQVEIESAVGHGTTVRLYLPRHLGPPVEDSLGPVAADALQAGQSETVLVVDDEPSVRTLAAQVLEDFGYCTLVCSDGASAMKLLRSDVRIDLLVTDVGLPGAMNGRQVADAAREVRAGLKVLFITGYAAHAVLDSSHLESGMHIMIKPFTMEALVSRIKALFSDGRNPS